MLQKNKFWSGQDNEEAQQSYEIIIGFICNTQQGEEGTTLLDLIFELQNHPNVKIYEIAQQIIDQHELDGQDEGQEDEQMEGDIANISSIKGAGEDQGMSDHGVE